MANLALIVDPDQMRTVASGVQQLNEEFNKERTELKASFEDELRANCSGDVSDAFANYYAETIDPRLVDEVNRLDGVVATLRASADQFDATAAAVKSAFNG